MRCGAALCFLVIAGCEITPANAPIAFKISQANGEAVDGVELGVLCELSDRIGSDYRAADIDDTTMSEIETSFGSLTLLNIGEVFCGGQSQPIGLPFTVDPQKRLVSTWSELANDSDETNPAWGSCVADTTRAAGDRVILCEIGASAVSPNLPFNLNPDQTEEAG